MAAVRLQASSISKWATSSKDFLQYSQPSNSLLQVIQLSCAHVFALVPWCWMTNYNILTVGWRHWCILRFLIDLYIHLFGIWDGHLLVRSASSYQFLTEHWWELQELLLHAMTISRKDYSKYTQLVSCCQNSKCHRQSYLHHAIGNLIYIRKCDKMLLIAW
jgi:hypothetical protein